MTLLQQLDALVRAGLEIRVRTVRTVRRDVDVVLIAVDIGDTLGEGETPEAAILAALDKMRAKLRQRYESDAAILAALEAPIAPEPDVHRTPPTR